MISFFRSNHFTLIKLVHSVIFSRAKVIYEGKASHAAAFPWEGVNALDATVMAYQNMSVMRQQMKPNWRIHGISALSTSFQMIFSK